MNYNFILNPVSNRILHLFLSKHVYISFALARLWFHPHMAIKTLSVQQKVVAGLIRVGSKQNNFYNHSFFMPLLVGNNKTENTKTTAIWPWWERKQRYFCFSLTVSLSPSQSFVAFLMLLTAKAVGKLVNSLPLLASFPAKNNGRFLTYRSYMISIVKPFQRNEEMEVAKGTSANRIVKTLMNSLYFTHNYSLLGNNIRHAVPASDT